MGGAREILDSSNPRKKRQKIDERWAVREIVRNEFVSIIEQKFEEFC